MTNQLVSPSPAANIQDNVVQVVQFERWHNQFRGWLPKSESHLFVAVIEMQIKTWKKKANLKLTKKESKIYA